MDNMNRAPHEGLSLSLRVFSMPELTRWIHKFSTEQDILALLRVCRHLHSCIIPLVWKTVKNVSVLIDLLPNVQSVLNTEATPSTRLRLPATAYMSRFNFYAPCVQCLTIDVDDIYKHENLDGLRSISTTTTLLPNLTEITYACPTDSDQDIFGWISLFLSPTLLAIRSSNRQRYASDGVDSWLDLEFAAALLRDISSSCPNLESLDIYPSKFTNKKDANAALPTSVIAHFSDYLSSFAHLRTLSSNAIMLEPGIFLALSKLPDLESLTLYPNESDRIAAALALPEDVFPSLRHLHLNKIEHNITDLCGLKPLVRQLTALEITPKPVPPNLAFVRVISLTSEIGTLAENNAILSSLHIVDDGGIYVGIDPKLIESFQHFPLRFLSLDSYMLTSGANLDVLLGALPMVEELHLIGDCLHMHSDLCLFASHTRLPHLRVLGLPIAFTALYDLEEFDFAHTPRYQSQSHMQLWSGFNDIGKNEDLTQPVAKYLHMLWPNITCSLIPRPYYNSEDDIKGLQQVNDALLAIRKGLHLNPT